LPGSSYLITRRCIQRQFFLTPDRTINDIFLFCLAHAAKEHGVAVHVATCLSNHFHLVVTDTEARLPDFMYGLDLHMAKCVNAYRGRWGALFEPESYSGVELIESADVFDKMIYTLINPV
jgi:REP element-mobilizing transposase RayT